MSIKSYGKTTKDLLTQNPAQELRDELYELIGAQFPLSLLFDQQQNLIGVTYETTWKEGGTEPVEKVNKKTGETTIEYKENYSNKKLTDKQIDTVDNWIKHKLAE